DNGTNILGTQLMAIEPYQFSKTAWFRSGLLKYHINSYLNLLASEPSACLISRSLAEANGIKRGDTLQIVWSGSGKADFTVYEIIDYWPSWNPNIDPNSDYKSMPMLVVTNLQYVQDHVSIEPYNVWLKLKPGATTKQVYDSITKNRLVISDINNAGQKIIELKNDPFQLGINGALTLGFVMSGFICFFGFLLYWILSIKSRTLQFGIFRAMGLSTRSLISMIAFEQIITSFAAFAAGIFIGLVTSRIFVPFFQLAFDSYTQVPPFKVVAYAGDRTKIYILIGLAMAICISALGYIMTRIKINQAIKLGED
ncbi:MAG: ABC transporter permease, partial [Bacillota bacterium]|nr:ABC transporter permease [Bacillota bacterium]